MLEEWRPVVGYENSHSISNLGRIKLNNYIIIRSDGKPCRIKERILKPHLEKNGYYRLHLRKKDSRRIFSVHRLVCEAFHGPPPSDKHQVDHINGNRGDNRAVNLRWVTPKENIHYAISSGGINVVGENNPAAKLTSKQVLEICDLLDNSDLYQQEIADMYGTVQSVISAIHLGVHWNSVTGRKKNDN